MISLKMIKRNDFVFKKVFKGVVISSLIVSSATYPAYGVEASETNSDSVEVNLNNLNSYVEYSTKDSIHFKNGESLTQEFIGDELVFITTDKEGNKEYQVQKIDDATIEIINLNTGEKTYEVLEKKEVDFNTLPGEIQNQMNIGLQSDYVYDRTVQTDTNIQAATVSLAAGIIASALGSAVLGVITSIATYYYSINQPHAYWYEVYANKRITSTQYEVRKQNIFYETHLYQNYINTVTQYYMRYNDRPS